MIEGSLNTIDFLKISNKDQTSRYYFTKYIRDENYNTIFDLFGTSKIISTTGKFHVVEESEKNRLDKISVRYYETPRYYWLIALANDMIDPFIVVPGTTLSIPSMTDFMNTNLVIRTGATV